MNLMEDANVIDLASRRKDVGNVSTVKNPSGASTVKSFPKSLTLRKTIYNRFPELKDLSLTENIVNMENIMSVLKKCHVGKKFFNLVISNLPNKTWFTIDEVSEAVAMVDDEIRNNMGNFRKGIELVFGDPVGPWLAFRNKICDFQTYPVALMFNVDKQYVDKILWDDIIPEQAQQDMVYDLVRNVPEHYTIAKLVEKYKLKQIDLAIFYEVQLSYREPDLQELEEGFMDYIPGTEGYKARKEEQRIAMMAKIAERQAAKKAELKYADFFHELLVRERAGAIFNDAEIRALAVPPTDPDDRERWFRGLYSALSLIESNGWNIEKGVGYHLPLWTFGPPKSLTHFYNLAKKEREQHSGGISTTLSIAESIEQAVNNDIKEQSSRFDYPDYGLDDEEEEPMPEHNPRTLGRIAANSGNIDSNPFPRGTPEYNQWLAGYNSVYDAYDDQGEELEENILDNIPKMSMSKLRTKSKFKRKQKKW
jgi:hypothetical protein